MRLRNSIVDTPVFLEYKVALQQSDYPTFVDISSWPTNPNVHIMDSMCTY